MTDGQIDPHAYDAAYQALIDQYETPTTAQRIAVAPIAYRVAMSVTERRSKFEPAYSLLLSRSASHREGLVQWVFRQCPADGVVPARDLVDAAVAAAAKALWEGKNARRFNHPMPSGGTQR